MDNLENKLKKALSILNQGLGFDYLDKDVHDLFYDRYAFEVNSDNPKALITKSWINSVPKNDEIDDFYDLTLYIEDGVYKFSIDGNIQKKIIKEITTDHLKYITRKHPNITKALINKKYNELLPEILTDFCTKLITNKFLFSMDLVFKKLENDIKFNKNKVIENFYFYNIDSINESLLFKELFFHLTKSTKDEVSKLDSIYNIFKKIESNNNIIEIINKDDKESILDLISKREKDHQYRLIFSKKLTQDNRILFDERSKSLLKELTTEGLTANDFHIEFIRKIAKYKDSDSLHKGLQTYSERKRLWSKEEYITKIISTHSKFIETEKDILLVEIDNFEASSKLGSASWCISTDVYAFNDYTENFQRQYFIYDFNKDADDSLSMTGVTIDYSGKIINAHDKNDVDLTKTNFINSYTFKALDKKVLISKILKEKNSPFSIFSDFTLYDIDGDIYNSQYHKMVEAFNKVPVIERSLHFNTITKNISDLSKRDSFLEKFHYDIDDKTLFDLASGVSFLFYNPSKFIFNYYTDHIKNATSFEKESIFSSTFHWMNKTKLYRYEDMGSFDFLIALIDSVDFKGLEQMSVLDGVDYNSHRAVDIQSKAIDNFISIFSTKNMYYKIKDESSSFDKIHSLDLYINIFRNGSSKFIADIDKELDPKMKKSLIKHFIRSYDIESLEKINTKQLYPDNIFKELNTEYSIESLDDALHAYSDSSYNNDIYQDLFSYAKNKNMILKNNNQYNLIALNPLLRNRLIEDKLIENDTYLKIVLKSYLNGQIFIDKRMINNTINEIEKETTNIKQPLFETEFINDFLEHLVYNKLITAKKLQKELPKTIAKSRIDLNTWFVEEIAYEDENKKKNKEKNKM